MSRARPLRRRKNGKNNDRDYEQNLKAIRKHTITSPVAVVIRSKRLADRGARMKTLIHKDLIKATPSIVSSVTRISVMCMSRRWRKLAVGTRLNRSGGRKTIQTQCANCHGAKLEGGAGPSLKGIRGTRCMEARNY